MMDILWKDGCIFFSPKNIRIRLEKTYRNRSDRTEKVEAPDEGAFLTDTMR